MAVATPFEPIAQTLGRGLVPLENYHSESVFQREKERIFKKSWLCVGREDMAPNPGDYFVQDLPVCDTSIIVTRNRQNQLRAFHNMCLHRGNKVAVHPQGNVSRFVCGFHGWAYDNDGQLRHVPDEGSFHGLNKDKMCLKSVALDTWQGFVFINVDPTPTQTLREHLGPLEHMFDGFPHQGMKCVLTLRAEVNANWKLLMDAYMEAYHVLELHARSAPNAFNSDANPNGHLNSIRLLGPHRSMSIYGNPEQIPTPAQALALKFVFGPSYTPAHSAKALEQVPGVNPDGRADWAFDSTLVFPNFSFYTSNGWFLRQMYWPVAPDKSIYESHMYMFEPTDTKALIGWEHAKTQLFDVALEDLSTVERTQGMLKSGAITEMYLSDQEVLVRHGHHIVDQIINR